MSVTKVLLADDHNLVRMAIKALLADVEDIEIIDEAIDGEEAIEKAQTLKPDLLLLDLTMPKVSGVEVTRKLKEQMPDLKILILSMHQEENTINQLIEAGADGYLLKDLQKDDLVKGIKKVLEGEKYFGENVSKILIESYLNRGNRSQPRGPDFSSGGSRPDINTVLTNRELEIVSLIMEGMTSQKISEEINISRRTVETHRANILQKLNLKNTAELVRLAIGQGIGKSS